jgi:hypothetical protein
MTDPAEAPQPAAEPAPPVPAEPAAAAPAESVPPPPALEGRTEPVGPPGTLTERHPEVLVGAAFLGGVVLATILRRRRGN